MLQAWFRLADEREPDPLALLMTVDALPPVTFDLGMPGWAPTLELTAHVRAHPAPGWLKVRHATRNMAGGMFEEDCEVWDSAGRLVAQSRQLARQPRWSDRRVTGLTSRERFTQKTQRRPGRSETDHSVSVDGHEEMSSGPIGSASGDARRCPAVPTYRAAGGPTDHASR